MFPEIDIKISVQPEFFLMDMENLAAQDYRVEVLNEADMPWLKMTIVNFRCNVSSPHEELGFQLIHKKDMPDRVAVELRALRWAIDGPTAGYDEYVAAARSTIGKLLTIYNRQKGSRLRLRIKRSQQGPTPSKRTMHLIEKFTFTANKSSLHPLDWHRFYEFVHSSRQILHEDTLEALLRERGFNRSKARKLTEIYSHLIEYKSIF